MVESLEMKIDESIVEEIKIEFLSNVIEEKGKEELRVRI